MNTFTEQTIQTNSVFNVTKSVTNSGGFLHPHVLFEKIQKAATYPIQEFFTHDMPAITDYSFEMTKSARVNDQLTIQAQLIKKDLEKVFVRIIVTKHKKKQRTEEMICSAIFGFSLSEKPIRKVS